MIESKQQLGMDLYEERKKVMEFHREVSKQVFLDALGTENKTIAETALYAVQCADALLLAMSTPREATKP